MTVGAVGWRYGDGSTEYQNRWGNRLKKPQIMYVDSPAPSLSETNKGLYIQHKLCLSVVNEATRTAQWAGIVFGAYDTVVAEVLGSGWKFTPTYTSSVSNGYWSPWIPGTEGPFKYNDWKRRSIMTFVWVTDPNATAYSTAEELKAVNVTQEWGIIKQKNVVLIQRSAPYRNFVKYPTQRNWGFYSPSTVSSEHEKLWTDVNTPNATLPAELLNSYGTNGSLLAYSVDSTTSPITYDAVYIPFKPADKFSWRNSSSTEGYGTDDPKKYFVWPCVGFEEDYITNWNQIYTTDFDNIANAELSDKSLFLKDDSGNYHVALFNGLPIVKIESNNSLITFDIQLKNSSYNITSGAKTDSALTNDAFVWFSDEPFAGWPNDQDCLDFTPLDNTCEKATTANFNKAVKVPAANAQSARVSIIAPSAKKYIWVKWATNGQYGGGTLVVPEKVTVTESG